MGEEISHHHFGEAEFARFRQRLGQETVLLAEWFQARAFSTRVPVAGLELEAWLVDPKGRPASVNRDFLAAVGNPLLVPELAQFNVEFNVDPAPLCGGVLSRLHRQLAQTWGESERVAAGIGGTRLAMIGILPSVRQQDLTLDNMSPLARYRALNEQVLRLREDKPVMLDILGEEHLNLLHHDVMLESATTSLQVHLKAGQDMAVRYYNAAQVISAPLVAMAANSPLLFGRSLWAETRIPLFEQSVEVGGLAGAARGPIRRVSFGTGYAKASLMECFTENEQHFPVLLPMLYDDPPEHMSHLRLHNGTIWRWNRPLIGFDDDGTPHLRIEQRVMPAGPTVVDCVANIAFFFGLVEALARHEIPPEAELPFATARDNFYAAARDGLGAQVIWLEGRKLPLQSLLLEQLLPQAAQGLALLGVDAADGEQYLDIIRARVARSCTGSDWQRAWVARHGPDMEALTQAYLERQRGGEPVHDWGI